MLYERYGRIVNSLAYRVTGDRGHAEECTQDVFVALWRRAADYDPSRAGLSTWLMTVARNRAIELVRRRQRRPEPVSEIDVPGSAPDSAELVAAADEAHRLAVAMSSLPPDQLEVLVLGYFDGLSHAEIAGVIGIPLGTVKGRMRLALDRLRTLVETCDLDLERL
jgi:RNA polymerase sigma-70 factor (ECF subfamily)